MSSRRRRPALGAEPTGLSARTALQVLRQAAARIGEELGLPLPAGSRLARHFSRRGRTEPAPPPVGLADPAWSEQLSPLDRWLALEPALRARPGTRASRRHGRVTTPRALAARVVREALAEPLPAVPRVLDPAVGGGVFLAELALACRSRGVSAEELVDAMLGVDVDPLALVIAELTLYWALDGAVPLSRIQRRLRRADALALPRCGGLSFDLVIGNPPWVAYAGRSAQALDARRRERLGAFRAFRGFPTLHAPFAELCADLAPRGVLALLLPSQVADLVGYSALRERITETHRVRAPLLELGEDSFDGVLSPTCLLVAVPGPRAVASPAPWPLREARTRKQVPVRLLPPPVLERLFRLPKLPAELFADCGFQSNAAVTASLLVRGDRPPTGDWRPLLEGRDVRPCAVGPPRCWLRFEAEALSRARARWPSAARLERVRFVIRQTAAVPVAALHGGGMAFRNSLLGGLVHPDVSPELIVGLLDSTLYAALHLAAHRDARQRSFPQVKVSHLRALPLPPGDPAFRGEVEAIVRHATERGGLDAALQADLDHAVFRAFGLTDGERTQTIELVAGYRR